MCIGDSLMRKATLRPASNTSSHTKHDLTVETWSKGGMGCRPCQGNKDLSQALSKKKIGEKLLIKKYCEQITQGY